MLNVRQIILNIVVNVPYFKRSKPKHYIVDLYNVESVFIHSESAHLCHWLSYLTQILIKTLIPIYQILVSLFDAMYKLSWYIC